MKYSEINVGAQVIYMHTQREMVVTALHPESETVTCTFTDKEGNTQETDMPAHFLELMRDGGMMDNM